MTTFLKNFARDLGSLRDALLGGQHGPGDFEFFAARHGHRLRILHVLGQGLYLICNNTSASMDAIAKNPRWLGAQVPFVELAEKIRTKPLVVSWDTKFFGRI